MLTDFFFFFLERRSEPDGLGSPPVNAPATTAILWKRISTSHNISEGDYQVVQMSGGWEGLEWGERERERDFKNGIGNGNLVLFELKL